MFEHYSWRERDVDMIPKGKTRVVDTYGSATPFEKGFAKDRGR